MNSDKFGVNSGHQSVLIAGITAGVKLLGQSAATAPNILHPASSLFPRFALWDSRQGSPLVGLPWHGLAVFTN
jgi:hypothetical protein